MINHVLAVLVLTAATAVTGELLCSEQEFHALGGSLPSLSSILEYSTCVHGVVRNEPCPDGEYFDGPAHKCSADVSSLKRHLVAVAAQFEELCDNPNLVQIFPHPTSCSEYVICFGSVPIMQTCANGLLFNPQLNTCDIPTNVVCGFSCPAEDDPNNPVWLPDSRLEDCARHYLCFQGEPNLFLCPNDLYFDMETRTCTFPQFASCYVPGVICDVLVTENIPNPRSCTSFYRCSLGFPHFRTCRSNEYFSEALGTCVEGECPPMTTTTATTVFTSTTGVSLSTLTTNEFTTTTSIPPSTQTPTGSTDLPSTVITSTTEIPPSTQTPTGSTDLPSTVITSTTEIPPSTQTPTTSTEMPSTVVTSTTEIPPSTQTTTDLTTESAPTELPTTLEPTQTETPPPTVTDTTTVDFSTTTDSTSVDFSTTTTTPLPSTTFEPPTATDPTTTSTVVETTFPEPTETTAGTESTTSEPVTLPTTEEITSTDEPTTVTTPTTVESTTTSTEMVTIDPNEVCANYPGIGALPYPDICYMYIVCVNGNGIVATCPSNQIFNPIILTCEPGNQETCTLGFSGQW
ncbi:uncharacterized protein LOC128728256 [Anopheles nili]|uniref:uncharacterized protein LOC128728256 n=1 Tax=Anopheles nili TaxID=185578 RepID=UPI00237BEEE6|nr:uncharacterized protein LOC128728256 [Anopheles nili]